MHATVHGSGHIQGIWVWNNANVNLTAMDFNEQAISFTVDLGNNSNTSFFSAVYTSHVDRIGVNLWEHLINFRDSHISDQEPWLLLGDFNWVLNKDKVGGK